MLNADIARAVVRIYRAVRGRGPTRARTVFREDIIVVLLQDVMTTAERSLLASGRRDEMLAAQRELQSVMHPELRAAVEQLTGSRAIAVLSQNNHDPDMAVEVFVMEQRVDPRRAGDPRRPRIDA